MKPTSEPPRIHRRHEVYVQLQTGACSTAGDRHFYGDPQPQALRIERAFSAKEEKILFRAERSPLQHPLSPALRHQWDSFPLLLVLLPHIPICRRPLLPANASHIKRAALPHPLRTPRDSTSFLRDFFFQHCVRGSRDTQSPAAGRSWPPSVAYRCAAGASAFKKSHSASLFGSGVRSPCFVCRGAYRRPAFPACRLRREATNR